MDIPKFNEARPFSAGPAGPAHVHETTPHTIYTTATANVPLAIPINVPNPAPPPAPKKVVRRLWYQFERPHPLLWVTLALSVLAVILGVPKGSLPTVTGRHKDLRAQELLMQERYTLLTQLSAFLPPPLATFFTVPNAAAASQIDIARLGHSLQMWQTQGRSGNWWTLEDLGAGAHVVRATDSGREREVWVLRTGASVGEAGAGDPALLAALTNSLLARERLHAELEAARSPCPACPVTLAPTVGVGAAASAAKEEWAAAADETRRLRERALELEEREQDIIRREMWVVDSMRKLSDKTRTTASHIDLEDRVVERLKAYQRQIKTEL